MLTSLWTKGQLEELSEKLGFGGAISDAICAQLDAFPTKHKKLILNKENRHLKYFVDCKVEFSKKIGEEEFCISEMGWLENLIFNFLERFRRR